MRNVSLTYRPPARCARLWGCTLLALLLAACGSAGQSAASPAPTGRTPDLDATPAELPPSPDSSAAPSANAPTQPAANAESATNAPTQPAASGAWQRYRSAQGGYSVEYPAGWAASERAEADGRVVTTLRPASGAGVVITLRLGGAPADNADLPNTRCQPVTAGGLSGTRCFDTISSGVVTTLAGQGRTFTIAAPGRGLDPAIYQRMLASFALFSS